MSTTLLELTPTALATWLSHSGVGYAEARLGLGFVDLYSTTYAVIGQLRYVASSGDVVYDVVCTNLTFDTSSLRGIRITSARLVLTNVVFQDVSRQRKINAYVGGTGYVPPASLTQLIGTTTVTPVTGPQTLVIPISNLQSLVSSTQLQITLQDQDVINGTPPIGSENFHQTSGGTVTLVVEYSGTVSSGIVIIPDATSEKLVRMSAIALAHTEPMYSTFVSGLFTGIGTEVSGGGYTRSGSVVFVNKANTAPLSYGQATTAWGAITHVGLIHGNSVVAYLKVVPPRQVYPGDSVTIPAGGIVIDVVEQTRAPELTTAYENILLYHVGQVVDMFPDAVYANRVFEVALFSSSGELTGLGGYSRQQVTFNMSGRRAVSATQLMFGPISGAWPLITAVALYINGVRRFFIPLNAPAVIEQTTRYVVIPAGQLAISVGTPP